MKIVIKHYPASFSFQIDEELPPFEDFCPKRQEILLFQLNHKKIKSYSHEYEDNYICHVIETKSGEEWVLGS
jgi:hypothetical protein